MNRPTRSDWLAFVGYLYEHDLTFPDLVCLFTDELEINSSEEEYHVAKKMGTSDAEFVAKMSDLYQSLSEPQRTVVTFLHAIQDGAVLFPMVLAQGRCNSNE